ncbi:MAG: Xaa-Pro peptidase family protein [Chitinivibrionia bacterium]|nr:Xaa-Pro peptidase family protein [Chitinivibrionia bacterium]
MTRFEKANLLLKKHKADYLLITDSISVRYFSGFVSSNVALLYSHKKRFLFTDSRYKTSAEIFCENHDWKFIEAKQNEFAEKLIEFAEIGANLLFQDNYMSVSEFEYYKKTVKNGINFIPCGSEIDEVFYVKTEKEAEHIKQAANIADKSYQEWTYKLRAGISEFEAARLLDIITLQNGSEKVAFDTIVLFGENCALPHGVPSRERMLKDGDFILCDFGCTVNGLCSDMTRTVCFGANKEEHRKIYEVVAKAQNIGVANVKAGIKAKEIDKIVRNTIKDLSFGEYFKHSTGHSIGLRVHERPALNSKDETVLQNGMVITVEPGIYIPEKIGVRIEDTVIVGDNGCKIITDTTKDFRCI